MIKPTRVVAKVVLIAPDGETLLMQRSATDDRRPLEWDLAGGAVDEGEDFVAAAVRETVEEAGIEVNPADLHLSFSMAADTERGNVCWLFFVCQLNNKPTVSLSHEHSKYQWLPFSEAVEHINYERQQIALKHIQQYVLG